MTILQPAKATSKALQPAIWASSGHELGIVPGLFQPNTRFHRHLRHHRPDVRLGPQTLGHPEIFGDTFNGQNLPAARKKPATRPPTWLYRSIRLRLTASSRRTAWQAIPSPRPVNPAFGGGGNTDPIRGTQVLGNIHSHGLHMGRHLRAWAIMVVSTFTTEKPSPAPEPSPAEASPDYPHRPIRHWYPGTDARYPPARPRQATHPPAHAAAHRHRMGFT